jgi:hypothetical protein
MKNLCFTERPLQFSEIAHKSLGNSIPSSALFFFSLVLPYPLPAASPLHLLSILISIPVSPSLFPLHGHRRRPKRWWRAAAAGGGSRRRRRPEWSGSAGEQSAGACARLGRPQRALGERCGRLKRGRILAASEHGRRRSGSAGACAGAGRPEHRRAGARWSGERAGGALVWARSSGGAGAGARKRERPRASKLRLVRTRWNRHRS